MATNKVVYGNTTLIDLTSDTATEADVLSGKTFHKKNGVAATGTASLAKPEQAKTVTATTSQQTVTPDSGKVLSSVTVNPQSHSGIYNPLSDTEYNDMGEKHEYRYVDTKDMYRAKSIITPSNSSPQHLDSGEVYKLSASGYAIESYTNGYSDIYGRYFPSGMVNMQYSGYAYPTPAKCSVKTDVSTGTKSYKITGVAIGAHYLLVVFGDSSKIVNNTKFDNVSISDCSSVTKLMNFYSSGSHNSSGTFWDIVPNKNSITVSNTTQFVLKLFSVRGE